jgi:chorismate dehydratase
LRVLLNEHFKIAARIRISSKPLTTRAHLAAPGMDAFLIIGDAALQMETSRFYTVYDLGEEWLRFSGLPFVFAVWAVRRNVNLRGFDQRLLEMKHEGSRHLRAIAKKASRQLALPETTCYDYLRNNVRHDLSDEEIRGMKLYYKLLVKHNLCPPGAKIRFYQGTRRSKHIR